MPSLDDFGGGSGTGGGGGLNFSLSASTFNAAGGAVSDLFGAAGDAAKAGSDEAEAGAYGIAATQAEQQEKFVEASTAIQKTQAQREATMQIGRQEAATAGAGFAQGGTGQDLLRESANQATLQQQVLGYQGLITEQGLNEQAASYDIMQNAAENAASAEKTAGIGADIGAALKIGQTVASLVAL